MPVSSHLPVWVKISISTTTIPMKKLGLSVQVEVSMGQENSCKEMGWPKGAGQVSMASSVLCSGG